MKSPSLHCGKFWSPEPAYFTSHHYPHPSSRVFLCFLLYISTSTPWRPNSRNTKFLEGGNQCLDLCSPNDTTHILGFHKYLRNKPPKRNSKASWRNRQKSVQEGFPEEMGLSRDLVVRKPQSQEGKQTAFTEVSSILWKTTFNHQGIPSASPVETNLNLKNSDNPSATL